MPQSTLTLDSREMVSMLRKFGASAQQKTTRAVNRSATSVRAAMSTAVRKDMGVPTQVVKSRISTINARPSVNPTAILRVKLKRLSLIAFKARQLKKGVKAKVRGAWKTYGGAFIPGARSGTRSRFANQVYRRAGKARLPIVARRGPSVGLVFSKLWRSVGAPRFREQLAKNLAHELRRS